MRERPNQKVNCCCQAHLPGGDYRLIAEPLPGPQDWGERGDHLGITPSAFSKVERPMTRQHLTIADVVVSQLRPYPKNARTHSKKQIRQIADSITRFGFTNPVLISDDNEIIAGHGRVEAAKLIGMKNVPTVRSRAAGTVRPNALAVLRLITSSSLVACSTGRSAGLAPSGCDRGEKSPWWALRSARPCLRKSAGYLPTP